MTAGLPFDRLVRMETRKLVDTRSGRWLVGVTALLCVLALGLTLRFGSPADLTLPMLVAVAGTVLALLLPLLGILTVASERSQRTELVTFALEPRRPRVVGAKLIAAGGWSLAGLVVLGLGLGAVAHVLAVVARDVPSGAGADWASLGGFALTLLLGAAQGVAFGLVLPGPASAVAVYVLLPTGWALLAGLVPGLARVAPWLEPTVSGEVLVRGSMQGTDWLHLAAANTVWVLVPLVVGLWLLSRRELG